ncbi:MAG: LptF/LptG family permease [Akkermansia sp.]
MKIFDRYIARQLLGVTALGVMALSALLLLGNLFKELRPLLVENKAPISIVLEFIFQVIPFSLMFSIPWGFLTAVLLVYGRLASDNELTSMRMSGMSLWRLSAPAIAIGIALSGLCYWINIDIAPRAKQSISELLIKAASINPKGLLNEGQAITNSTTWKSTLTSAWTTSSTACTSIRRRTTNPPPWPCTRNA